MACSTVTRIDFHMHLASVSVTTCVAIRSCNVHLHVMRKYVMSSEGFSLVFAEKEY